MDHQEHIDPKSLWRILDVTRQLSAPIDLQSMFAAVIDAAREVLHAERATVFLYDADTNELWASVATAAKDIRFPATQGIAGECAQTYNPINVTDCYADPRFNREIDKRTGYKTRCLIAIPLVASDNQLVGVLQVLNKIDAPSFTDLDIRLAQVFATHCAVALQRAQLIEQTIDTQRMQRDLTIARDIQLNVLPQTMPTLQGYDLAGWTEPADETGGDIYDAIQLDPNNAMLFLADATGHGIGPALSVTQCRAMFRLALRLSIDLPQMFTSINAQLTEDLHDNRFITAFFGKLNIQNHAIDYIAAGQGPLIHYHAATAQGDSLEASTIPLGITDDPPTEDPDPIILQPGDILALLSDGYFEYADPTGHQFGADRVVQVLQQHHHLPMRQLIQTLNHSIDIFSKGADQLDDMTALLVKRHP